MRWTFSDSDHEYLDGTRFSNAHAFRGIRTPPEYRADLIVRNAAGKKVIDVGFADHIELVNDKRNRGEWLHDRVAQVAALVVGVDTNQAAVESVSELGVSNVFAVDLAEPITEPAIAERDFDLIILGEVLEHIGNPVGFLRSVVASLGRPNQQILITVPNAWSAVALINVFRGAEVVNTDHRFWFTPFTVAKVAIDAGLAVDRVETCLATVPPRSSVGRLGNAVMARFGLLRPHVVCFAHVPALARVSPVRHDTHFR